MAATWLGEPPKTLGFQVSLKTSQQGAGSQCYAHMHLMSLRQRGGLQVAVEVNHGDRPVGFVDAPQQGQGNSMITSQGDNARECLACARESGLMGIGKWLAH